MPLDDCDPAQRGRVSQHGLPSGIWSAIAGDGFEDAGFDFVDRVDPSGYVMTVNHLKDRELESATYDEKGDLLTEPIMAGELRIDVRVPEGYPLPELSTRVFPENPDMEYQ